MFQSLQIFETAHAMARHAATRQAVTARNIANADTPGYRALDVAPFQTEQGDAAGAALLRRTRAGHFGATTAKPEITASETALRAPNGNGVSLEEEMVRAVEARRQHDRALAIYKSSLTILRSSIGQR